MARKQRCDMRHRHYGRSSFGASNRIVKHGRVAPRKVESYEYVKVKSVDCLTGRTELWLEKRVHYAATDRFPKMWVAVGGELLG